MKKILYVSYGGGHANIAQMIYRYVQSRGTFVQQVLALTVAPQIFKAHQVPYSELHDYLFLMQEPELVQLYGAQLAQTAFDPNAKMEWKQMVAYHGIGFYDLADEMGYEAAIEQFHQLGRKAFCPVRSMSRILRYEQPDLLVLTSSVRYEKAAGIAANQLGIPVVRIVDLPMLNSVEYECSLCVMNAFTKRLILQKGLGKEDKIYVTGQPVFEHNLSITEAELNHARDELHLACYPHVVLYLEQNLEDMSEVETVEDALMIQASIHPEMLYIFKCHPNQPVRNAGTPLKNVIVTKEMRLKPLLHLCDVAITKHSTSGLEAALLDKPLVCVVPDGEDAAFERFGIALRILKPEQLASALAECMDTNSAVFAKLAAGRREFQNQPNALENIYEVLRRI